LIIQHELLLMILLNDQVMATFMPELILWIMIPEPLLS